MLNKFYQLFGVSDRNQLVASDYGEEGIISMY